MPRLSILLLGSFQIARGQQPITDFVTDKTRALLAYLAVECDRPHRRESLAGLLWPDQPDQDARRNLRQALFNLRQALADTAEQAPLLCIDRHEVQFAPGVDLHVDVAAFTHLLTVCDQHRHRRLKNCAPCLLRLKQLLQLYRGEFLAGFSLDDSTLFEEWLLLKREWLHGRAVEALITLADYHERRGEYDQARRYAQQQVHFEPWREEAHRQLMRLLAFDGQRSAALAQYQTCRRALQAELGVEPGAETIKLLEQIKLGSLPNPTVPSLPSAPTPFVGRETDRAELADRLAAPEGRLITLAGPGGIGKSRLALQIAHDQRGLFADGVHWAALGSIDIADLIVPAIAAAVGLLLSGKEPPQTQLINYLREKHLLLILDNVEQLPEVGGLVAELLRQARNLTLLITSRERLALQEEWIYEVAGLAYPRALRTDATGGEVEQHDALLLFTQSARRVSRQFSLNSTDLAALLRICRLVEGMPLALEMAAAWTTTRSCAEIAQAIEASLDLLTTELRNVPERQRSVRATFEHSWTQLSDRERQIFARLSVFRGSFSADAAQRIAAATVPELDALVLRSLLRAQCISGDRYQLHELLRQFAAEKLAAQPDEVVSLATHHATYYAAFLADRELALKGAAQDAALHAIDEEIANVRCAWEWAIGAIEVKYPAARDVLRQSQEALLMFFWLRSWYHEGAALFGRAATAVERIAGADDLLVGQLLARQARCQEFTAPAAEATALYQRSLSILQAQRAEREAALPLYGLGYMAHLQGRFAEARQNYETSLALYREAGDRWGAANVLSNLCLTLRRQGTFDEARRCGLESLELRRAIGDRRGIASAQNNLALIYTALGEHATAETALHESLEICRDIGHTIGEANALTTLCQLAYYANDHAAAIRYQSAALALYQQVGDLWGVAIAYNNLGQLNLENDELVEAMVHFQQSVKLYRQLGIQTGLANALSNVGQVHYLHGKRGAAAQSWHEALHLTLQIGDVPIGLEILLRAATLWAQQDQSHAPLSVIAFVRQQPALLEETRRMSEDVYAELQSRFTPESIAADAAEARQCDFECMATKVLAMLQAVR
ncbi:Putative HTH-type transcriptional regulator [Thermoflexales bacterium]|nr:Putative HTH-type transcriptional regulator [Thermoflexales bacterium]